MIAKQVALSDVSARWIESKRNGLHHVFRMRYVCPHCKTPWYQDVTDEPEVFAASPIPDRRKLGRAMLCGRCDALSRMVVGFSGDGIESQYAISKADLYETIGKLYSDKDTTWVSAEGIGPYNGDPKSLLDEKIKSAQEINFVEVRTGLYHRRAGVTAKQASDLGWVRIDAGAITASSQAKRRMV